MAINPPSLSLWERAGLFGAQLSAVGAALYSALTGVFRGKTGAHTYMLHVGNAMIRSLVGRLSARQLQYVYPPTKTAYESFMKSKGLEPDSVTLSHGATAHWIGNKNAENVVIYYHGGGFAIPASEGHFEFLTSILPSPENNDIAIFLVAYTLTPHDIYPTQLRQSIAALQYILSETARPPNHVLLGGDSAGGNLALAVLLHLAHPHPDIDPLDERLLTAPLAGVFGFAPWVRFSVHDDNGEVLESMIENRNKDMIPPHTLGNWSRLYLADGDRDREGDAWSEPDKAPLEWWRDAGVKTQRMLFLVGRDEILFSGIEAFVRKVQSVVPDATYIVGHGETHVAPVYSGQFLSEETQQGKALKSWLAAL